MRQSLGTFALESYLIVILENNYASPIHMAPSQARLLAGRSTKFVDYSTPTD